MPQQDTLPVKFVVPVEGDSAGIFKFQMSGPGMYRKKNFMSIMCINGH